MGTGLIYFDYQDGNVLNVSNQFPLTENEIGSNNKLTFSISGHNTLTNGVEFKIYAIPGDAETGRTRLLDNTMKMKFIPPANGDGISITTNNYSTATSPSYTNGEILIATGLIKDTTLLTTKTYEIDLWLDSNLAFVSSTTKRTTLAEGNPSMAVSTSGNVTADRYMKNSNQLTTVTVFPAKPEAQNKIIYTTNEFANSYYSIKLRIEANEIKNNQ